ncbi:dynein heavy chain 9, axonemal isoform X1 [Eleginops maclovinus]|uniref:dynein heavy chain 9, axonemal isoform X1 n=1 Tax=Eleginops maclovinus TaxID=56733 RepID=UPI00307FD7C8
MEGSRDERLDLILRFTLSSLGLKLEVWRDFLSEEENQVTLSSFFSTADYTNLFLCRDPRLRVSLTFPTQTPSKVLCISRTSCAVITSENIRDMLIMQEVQGGGAVSCISAVCQEITCPLLSNLETSGGWAPGVAEEALRFMELQKNEALVMEAQIDGRTFLPHPHALHDNHLHGDVVHDGDLHDNNLHADVDERKLSDLKLLHACDWTIIEWAELVAEFLQQDSSQAVLDGLKPLPSEEFNFWRNRLKNMLLIQQQLSSSRAQQVVSIVQRADSVYLSTLRDIHTDLQQGLKEAQDVTENLDGVQQKLEELQLMEFQQLEANTAVVMEEVQLLWIRSEFYCKPCRVVVLLQELCNLFIQRSREFLQGGELLHGLLKGPAAALQAVSLVVRTLQSLRETFSQSRRRLQDMKQEGAAQSWDFPSHLVFLHLDTFLLHLQNIQEVYRVSLQLGQLEDVVVSGAGGRKWTEEVQEVYQDFLHHVTSLSECTCDPIDPMHQGFRLLLDKFQLQVVQVERRLVSVLCRALQDCSEPCSAAKLLQMFSFMLHRPLIQEQLRPQLLHLLQKFLLELDLTEQLFYNQREEAHTFSCYTPLPAAALCWSRQLRLRAGHMLDLYTTLQHLYRSSECEQVEQRVQQLQVLLQDFRARWLLDWINDLDSDCGVLLQQQLIQQLQQGMLGVTCSHTLEAVLRQLRCLSRDPDVELRPLAAHLFSCRDDITESYLSLGHMVSCYNQVLQDGLQVEQPLIQDQLRDLDQNMAKLQSSTWGSGGVHQLVQQLSQRVLMFHSTVCKARANMDAMTGIIQGWAELRLLHSGNFLSEDGAAGRGYRCISEEGQELLRLTQVNCSLYAAEHAPPRLEQLPGSHRQQSSGGSVPHAAHCTHLPE